jgi:membrane protease YdiL (CAAX protease family)
LALLAALWAGYHQSAATALGRLSFPRAFACFALLLAPLWFFSFGAAEPLKNHSSTVKILATGSIGLPYFVFTVGTSDFYWRTALVIIAFPMLIAAFLELPQLGSKMSWRDAAALAIVAASYFLKWFAIAWPSSALAVFPKLFLADVVLYCFVFVRKIEGAGYSLVPTRSALTVGIRQWLLYLPIALVLGELIGFIHFHARIPTFSSVVGGILVTFLLIALPEELFFRAILQNLLETRLGRTLALVLASVLFGLSHFNHGSRFNWRYVLLASIAGFFYGRAWRANRQILVAVITHTGVDVVWSLWFR